MSIVTSIYIVILLGLVIYFIKPGGFMLYCITIEPIVLPIIANLLGIHNYEELHEIKLKIIGTGIGTLLIIVFLIEFVRRKKMAKISNVVVSFVILCCYLFFFYLIHNFDLNLYFVDVRQSMIPLFVICLLFTNSKFVPTIKQMNIYIYIFIVYELVWCILNLKGIYIYKCQYIENTTFRDLDGFKVDLVSGTFQRFSDLSDFFSTIYLYVCLLFFYEEKIDIKNFVFLSVMIFSIILMSGAKVSFILVFSLILYCSFTNWKKYKFVALSLIVGSIVVLMLLLSDMARFAIEMPGLSRIVNQLYGIVHSSDKSEIGTLSLSAYLLDNFFWRDPIWGTGLVSYNGAEAYGLTSNFKTDARIAYILTEYGILGLGAYLYYYYTIFKILTERMGHKNTLFLSFCYFFLLTITQPGLFGYIPIFIYIFLSVVFRNEKKTKISIQSIYEQDKEVSTISKV